MRPRFRKISGIRLQYVMCVLLLLLFNSSHTLSQEVLISGEYKILMSDESISLKDYKTEAKRKAIENALDKKFGTSVKSDYQRINVTEMQGRSVEYNSEIRNHFINTFPNGEWIKDEDVSFIPTTENGIECLICRITGYARKNESADVDFQAYLLDGPDKDLNISGEFINGERGYLYFKSPQNGYIVVFLEENERVNIIVPYSYSDLISQPVERNKEYLFFSKETKDNYTNEGKLENLFFVTSLSSEINRIYILFSPSPLGSYSNNPIEKNDGVRIKPKWIDKHDFNYWLQKNRLRNKDIQLQIIDVTIKKSTMNTP